MPEMAGPPARRLKREQVPSAGTKPVCEQWSQKAPIDVFTRWSDRYSDTEQEKEIR